MATNPMQRKANNYLLTGILVTALIASIFIVILFMQLNTLQQEKKEQEANMKKVYVALNDIKSGETVSYDKLKQVAVTKSVIPSNVLSIELTDNTIAKIDLNAGTIVTDNMLQESDAKTTNDLRKQEYNMVILPSQIQSGDYIDIRLRLSNGVDYIVASKKKVEIPMINGVDSANTITINMNETETMVMANAIIEAYIDAGSLLYATTYVEPGMQGTVTPTYIPSGTVQSAINANPNIEQEAKNALFARYNQNAGTRTNIIDGTLAQYAQDRVDNIEAGVQEQILKAQEERQAYLESLG
ncbi:MAG: SAF domain-containing protein [Clostridia bacterium]|nr:SAF domain-containing protein [Clostridia bacterium]